jgi:hypothetical protein
MYIISQTGSSALGAVHLSENTVIAKLKAAVPVSAPGSTVPGPSPSLALVTEAADSRLMKLASRECADSDVFAWDDVSQLCNPRAGNRGFQLPHYEM